ncbi:endo-alpha-N-acetylgalactosaminidase family protein [Paenibacillus sp. R14(2021)]|uniref:endo-alpha-N-acetylgalactosaminidase family protein n=1 Tax=Paenibacillus sp. R14(2021) TaxID=2859228 RepID=UPI001C611842|nr:endo-alpha-N-acetylgalactosaminidase family protein [Paenibacillus sp. R14(2021)]
MFKLENAQLRVELHAWPGVNHYLHKPTGIRMKGSGPNGKWAVNGVVREWADWRIEYVATVDAVTYRLTSTIDEIKLIVTFRLAGGELDAGLEVDEAHSADLQRLDWIDQPLLACSEDGFAFVRTELHPRSWRLLPGGGRGLYDRCQVADIIANAVPDRHDVSTMHACVFGGGLCAFVHTNYPVAPLVTRLLESGRHRERAGVFAIGPQSYQYRVRDEVMPPLRMTVALIDDLNGDGSADECDYHLWLNRRMPDANPLYKEAIWYKIFCADPKRGVLTSFKETLDIIRHIYHITGGVPQIVYLVGWQFDGHDTGYPSLNRLHPGLAEKPEHVREELLELIKRAKVEYACTVSFHINMDDAYVSSPDWNPDLISRDPDGSLRVWLDPDHGVSDGGAGEARRAYHINHVKDVESGEAFRRLNAFLELVPVKDTIHLDAFRNTNASWDGDSYIGPLEELICGMKPIIAYFNERGIDVTTEGQNGMPIEDAGLFSAYWHFTPSLLYHGKILGGGSFGLNAATWGRGVSIDADILYRGEPSRLEGDQFVSNDFLTKWHDIVDILYLGSMLYRFYLEREMVDMRETGAAVAIRFADGINVWIDKAEDRLSVRKGSLVIAEDHDRFIPMNGCIYAYSRYGTDREWELPEDWRMATAIRASRLSATGKESLGELNAREGKIRLSLEPHVPVLLERE